MSLPRSFDLSRIKTEHPRTWETENPSRSPLFPIPPKLPKCVKSDAIGKSVGEASNNVFAFDAATGAGTALFASPVERAAAPKAAVPVDAIEL